MAARRGDTLLFPTPPVVAAHAAIGGKKGGGPPPILPVWVSPDRCTAW